MSKKELIDIVRELLKEGGKSLGQVARETGLNIGVVSRIASGTGCTVETAQKILDAFGCQIKIERKKGRAK